MPARAATLLILVAVVAAACGSMPTVTSSPAAPSGPTTPASGPPGTQPAESGVAEIVAAAEATIAMETVSIDQLIEFNGSSQIPDGTSASLIGGTSLTKPKRLAATADFTAMGLGEFEMIVDDHLIYVRGTITEALGEGTWLFADMDSDDPRAADLESVASGQNDASLLLYFLYGAEEPVEALPDRTLEGQPTRVRSMQVDLDGAIARAPDDTRPALAANVRAVRAGGMRATLDAEVWIGADGLVHRVDYVYSIGPATGGGTLLMSCIFGDFGVPLDLGIPAETDIVRLEDIPLPD